MKRNLRILLSMLAGLVFLYSCQKDLRFWKWHKVEWPGNEDSSGTGCGTPVMKDLYDMGGIADRGDLAISNDNDHISIRVTAAESNVYVKKIIAVAGSHDHVQQVITETNIWTPCQGPEHPDRVKISDPKLNSDTLMLPDSLFQQDGCTWMALYVTLTNDEGFEWCTYPVPYDDSIPNVSIWKTYFQYCRQTCEPPPPPTTDCYVPQVKDLFDMGGVADRGDLLISNDADSITLKAVAGDPGVYVKRIIAVFGTREHVVNTMDETVIWTPCVGPAHPDTLKLSDPGLTADSIRLPNSLFGADGCVWMAVYVTLTNDDGFEWCTYPVPYDDSIQNESIWKTFFKYCRQQCEPSTCGQLRTQTQGGWGAMPHGQNPGTYLHQHFAMAFPDGITLGCYPGNYHVQFSSAWSITHYLPAGGEAATLKHNYSNPATRDLKNTLVSQLLALSLSVQFDNTDPDFGEAGVHLGDMLIARGKFEGWTVADFLKKANEVLGGCSTDYKAKDLVETATRINENYVDGRGDRGYLTCPR